MKFSSLHDDLLWPCVAHACGLGEFDATGKRVPVTERSPVVRAAQFGVADSVWATGNAALPVGDAMYEPYCEAVVPAVCQHYETVIAAVFDRYLVSETHSSIGSPTAFDREQAAFADIAQYHSGFGRDLHIVRSGEDLQRSSRTNLVLAVEGMDFVQELSQVERLLEAGVRVFALQYNRPNALANEAGLTALGRQVIVHLFAAGAILDLAHSAPATRSNVLDFAEEQGYGAQVTYSHGAILNEVTGSARFLRDEEARRITRLGGIVGLTPALPFFPSLARFAERIYRLCTETVNGATGIALGTDFGGIWEGSLFPEVRGVADLGRIGDVLAEKHGFTDPQIGAVLRTNTTEWLQRALRKS